MSVGVREKIDVILVVNAIRLVTEKMADLRLPKRDLLALLTQVEEEMSIK